MWIIITLIQDLLTKCDWNKKYKSVGLLVGNKTIHHHLFVDDQAIVGQDKDDSQYGTKI